MDAYKNDEIRSLPEGSWPTRGQKCERCHACIPKFADLTPEAEASLRALAEQDPVAAMKELSSLTGCNLRWAKIWVLHPNGPQPKYRQDGPPCLYCGEVLRTAKAKQCLSCGMDWHDPNNVIRHEHKE